MAEAKHPSRAVHHAPGRGRAAAGPDDGAGPLTGTDPAVGPPVTAGTPREAARFAVSLGKERGLPSYRGSGGRLVKTKSLSFTGRWQPKHSWTNPGPWP